MEIKKEFIQKIQILPPAPEKDPADLHSRGWCPAAGGTDPDRPGMCRKDKECKLFECNQRNRRKDNWFCSFF